MTFVRAEEYSDLRTYEAPDVVRHVMGFGEVPEKALSGPMQKLLDGGFIQAVRMIVDKAGFNADPKVRSSQEIAVATAPIESPIGVIEPGQVAGRKFHWEALVGDEVVVRVTVNWLMGEEKLDPAWTFGPEGQRYEMEVRGNPDISISVKGFQSAVGGEGPEYGIVGTAAHCVNSVPAVCAAEPGIVTYLDLPLISGKAAPPFRLVAGQDAAVERDDFVGQIAVAQHGHCHIGYLVGPADAADRDGDRGCAGLQIGGKHLRLAHQCGGQAVDSHAVGRDAWREVMHEAVQARLARCVVGADHAAGEGGDRRDEQDAPVLALDHRGQNLLRQQPRSRQVDCERRIPRRQIDLPPALYVGGARVGDQQVDGPNSLTVCATSAAGACGSERSAATTVTRRPCSRA